MNLYVASSWKNTLYNGLLGTLRADGFDVWDWRNPPTGGGGFQWREVCPHYDPEAGHVLTPELNEMLQHPRAQAAFRSDMMGMVKCDACILLLPSGRSAHMEAGYICGRGKPVHVFRPPADGPDLMHLMFDSITGNYPDLVAALKA